MTFLAACSATTYGASTSSPQSATTASASSAAPVAAGPTLTISEFSFSALTVAPGSMVTVRNQDAVAHTVHVNGTDVDVTVPPDGQGTFTAPAAAGSYPLTCDFHPRMHGTLTVAGT